MQVKDTKPSLDTALYALKKSMQVQENIVEKIIDSAFKQQQNTPSNTHLGKYFDMMG